MHLPAKVNKITHLRVETSLQPGGERGLEIRILGPGAISLKIARKLLLVYFFVHKFIWEPGAFYHPACANLLFCSYFMACVTHPQYLPTLTGFSHKWAKMGFLFRGEVQKVHMLGLKVHIFGVSIPLQLILATGLGKNYKSTKASKWNFTQSSYILCCVLWYDTGRKMIVCEAQ